MNKIEIRALGRVIKLIEYGGSDDINKVVDYASFIITNASYTLFNGECFVKINDREATSESELRKLLDNFIRERRDVRVELQQMRKETMGFRVPSDIVVHATSISPPLFIK